MNDQWLGLAQHDSWQELFFFFALDIVVDEASQPSKEVRTEKMTEKIESQQKGTQQKKTPDKKSKLKTNPQKNSPVKNAVKTPKSTKGKSSVAKAAARKGNTIGTKKHDGEKLVTPPRKKPEMKEKGSAEKHKEKNSRAAKSQCRPANFGKKQEQASSLLAKPGRKVAFPEDKSKRKSKDQPKAAEDEQEDDDEFELGEDHEIDLQCPRIRRKRHERKCRKLVASESIVKQKALRSYLGAVGITWPAFQKAHARWLDLRIRSNIFCFIL